MAGRLEKLLFRGEVWVGDFALFSHFHIPCNSYTHGKSKGGSEGAGGMSFLEEVWRRFLPPPDMAWLLEFCKTEEMGVNSSQLVNTEPLQN